MSTESAKKFLTKMLEDKVFAEAVEKQDGKEAREALIRKEGFDFTRDELTTSASEMNAVDVVGGKCCGSSCEHDPRNINKCV